MADMTAETDLLPLPYDLAHLTSTDEDRVEAYARACVSSATEALRAEVAKERDYAAQAANRVLKAELVQRKAEARAERLAEALRGIETKPVHSMDHARSSLERKRAMSECADAARAALEQEGGNG